MGSGVAGGRLIFYFHPIRVIRVIRGSFSELHDDSSTT
jgi:hypothetical protein